jgi:hypothetical protein
MKLLEKGNRITLFEGGIVVDENLLKYKNLVKDTTEKVTLSSKEDLKESEVNINFNRIVNTDPDSITPGQFLFLEGEKEIEATDKILKGLSRVKEVLGEMGLSEKTAMPELLKWHKRYLRLSALYSSMKESKLPLMNGTYMLVSKRLAFVRSIWGIYYDILDGISHNDPTLSKELLRLKQEKRKNEL